MENGELNAILGMASKLYEQQAIEAFVEIEIENEQSIVIAAVVGGTSSRSVIHSSKIWKYSK